MERERRRVTIRDVAKAANVSIATVSRILNNRDGKISISEKTRERVIAEVNKMGFQLNPVASALRTKRSGLIGAVIQDVGDPFLAKLVNSLYQTVHDNGQELLIGHSDYREEVAEHQIQMMVKHFFDGLIMFTDPGQSFLQQLKTDHVPHIGVTGGHVFLDSPGVRTNDAEGISLALEHLIAYGHRRIGFVGSQSRGIYRRLAYFQSCMLKHGLPMAEVLSVPNVHNVRDISEYVRKVRDTSNPLTAVVCSTDTIAMHVINSAHYHGLHVPRDISVVGFDDIDAAKMTLPSLTTVQQPYEELSQKAVKLILELIESPQSEDLLRQVVLVSPQLVVRESSGPV